MISYISLFSGMGAWEKALENLGIEYDLIAYCEIDKFASKAYSVIHNQPESKNLGDITKVDEQKLPIGIDLITYSPPCTDISVAGLKKGFFDSDGNKTRSGLFFDSLRIIKHCQPKIAVMENVKNLLSEQMSAEFDAVKFGLKEIGYSSYWQVLNAKDFGVAQNRERIFIVSYRNDIDPKEFHFPTGVKLEKTLGDYLEINADPSFDLPPSFLTNIEWLNSDDIDPTEIHWAANLHHSTYKRRNNVMAEGGVSTTLCARDYKEPVMIYEPHNQEK